jgi:hypothetical protein
MSKTRQILARLQPYRDRIAHRPLAQGSITRLEQALGLTLPQCLADFLQMMGYFQDLTHVETNAVLVFESISEYLAARQDLLDGVYGEIDMHLIPFGHNGASDLYALRAGASANSAIYYLSQTSSTASLTGTTFEDWLEGIVNDCIASIDRRIPNRDKLWYVQFAFRGADFDAIVQTMQQAGQTEILSSDWEYAETSTTGVHKSSARLSFAGKSLLLKRLDYPHWVSPWYFMDMDEPLELNGGNSAIQQLDTLFSEHLPGYGLINYGARQRGSA